MLITRKVEFSASHVCRLPQLSERENRELFAGKQPYLGLKRRLMRNLHGSLYEIEIGRAHV